MTATNKARKGGRRAKPSRYRQVKCQCTTRWLVNFGDRRGELPTSALIAATASGMGLRVRLASISASPFRPVTVPGLSYERGTEVIDAVCDECGYPTRMVRIIERKRRLIGVS